MIKLDNALAGSIEKYRRKRRHADTNSAVQALIRLGLFYDAAPIGSVIIRRDDGANYETAPTANEEIEF
jgi:hypothetical protein